MLYCIYIYMDSKYILQNLNIPIQETSASAERSPLVSSGAEAEAAEAAEAEAMAKAGPRCGH